MTGLIFATRSNASPLIHIAASPEEVRRYLAQHPMSYDNPLAGPSDAAVAPLHEPAPPFLAVL
jgi:hypothetical protein